MSNYEFIPYSAGSGGGGGSVFTDVTAFPTENVDKSVIYRAQEQVEPVVYMAGMNNGAPMVMPYVDMYSTMFQGAPVTTKVYVVETLPATLEAVLMDINNPTAGVHIPLYVIESTGQVYMNVDPTEDPLTYPVGGWVDSVDDIVVPEDGSLFLYVVRGASYPVYGVPSDIRVFKNGVWDSVSTDGDGVLSLNKRTFNSLKSAMDNAARVPMFYRCVCDGRVKLTFSDGTTKEVDGVFNEFTFTEYDGGDGIKTAPTFMQNSVFGGMILFYASYANAIIGMYSDDVVQKEVTSVDESGISNITLYYFA